MVSQTLKHTGQPTGPDDCDGIDCWRCEAILEETKTMAQVHEIRVKNEKTGGEKGEKPQRYDLIPWSQMDKVAELYGRGAEKYAPRNWEKGYDWHLSFSSMMRHATQFWEGESYDAETKCHHLASVIFHALALMYFEQNHPDLDDRPCTDESSRKITP